MESQVKERILSLIADGVEKFPSSIAEVFSSKASSTSRVQVPSNTPVPSLVQSIRSCSRCSLVQERKKVLFAENLNPHPFFVLSEFPEQDDELYGGPHLYSEKSSGGLILKLIEKLGILPQSHLSYALKCTPNKGIPAGALQTCVSQNLAHEIAAVQPKVILCFGQKALKAIQSLSKPLDNIELSENNSLFLAEFDTFSCEVYYLSSSRDLQLFPHWRVQVWRFLSKFSQTDFSPKPGQGGQNQLTS